MQSKDQERAHVRISGQVQGVFFRDSTRQKAVELNLAGWVKNLPDGRVVVENPPPQLPRVLEMFWPGLDRIEVAL